MMNEAQAIHPGKYIKENIIPKGLSVKNAAEMMGVGRPALSNFLNGKANLSSQMATRLEKTFSVKKEDLITLQQEYDTSINKEQEKRIAVKSYTPSFLKITATHIETWANKIEARSLLPVLLRKLVNTTGAEIISSSFPAYDQSQTPGWDGYTESESATPWVPTGKTGWEFGCDQNITTKANSDYKARLTSVLKSVRKDMTLAFITPRKWKQKDKWLQNIKAEKEWGDIKAFDASDIEQWLELSVPAQVWMAEQLGLPTNECQSLSEYWACWSKTSTPAISQNIFNSAISDHSEKLEKWLASKPDKPLIVTAASKEEARAFLCSLADRSEKLGALSERAMFVSSSDTIKRLSEISTQFIPIVYSDDAQHELALSFSCRHCIVITERNTKTVEPDIALDLPNYESFKDAIEAMGLDEAQLNILANQSGRSPTILRRILAVTPALKKPGWVKSITQLRDMIPLTLAGSWNSSKQADTEILSCLADKSYTKIEQDIANFSQLDDAPIWSEGQYRGVISELESLYTIADCITRDDFDNFFFVAELVLSEDDPSLDLPKKDRWAANIYDKVRDHSEAIRQSICQNLTLLSVHGNSLFGKRLGMDVESRVEHLINTLLRNKDARVWQAQQSDLPQYAEASPEAFLTILEEELQKNHPAFETLFEPAESGMFSRCERTGMLWALELLAWNPSRLARVIKVLGKLSTYDLDDNWSNKPINSLKDILLTWRPHTAATVEQRCDVLELLCSTYPDIGWQMAITPLEPGSSFTSGTYRPKWRGDASGSGQTITHGEARKYVLKCLEIVLTWPSQTAKTLKALISCMPSMMKKDKVKVVEIVKGWVSSSPCEEEMIDLREHIRTRTMTSRALMRHKKNGDDENYANGKELYELLNPKNSLLKHRWLFAENWVEYTPEELHKDNFDHDAREKGLKIQRVSALKEIYSHFDIAGFLDLLKKSRSGHEIGKLIYSEILTKEKIDDFILKCLVSDEENNGEFGACIGGVLYQFDDSARNKVLTGLIQQLSSHADKIDLIVKLYLSSPFTKVTWRHLEGQCKEIQQKYWSKVNPGWCDSEGDISFAATKLIDANRPFAAFNLVHFKFDKTDSELIIKLLNQIASNSSGGGNYYKPSQHDIEEALKVLNGRNDFDKMELVKLEYLYVDILYSHSSYGIPNLSREISDSPLFFIQLVAYSFKRDDEKEDPEEWGIPKDKEKRSILAGKAYHVLEAIKSIPGAGKNDEINTSRLRDWILQVRSLAKTHGRVDMADQQIGKLLSNSGVDKDGIWPKKEIRTVFEEISSPQISVGMELGLYNNRAEGMLEPVDSLKDKSRADEYSEMAEKVMNKTPFVGKMLMSMANRYVRDAEYWQSNDRVNKRLRDW